MAGALMDTFKGQQELSQWAEAAAVDWMKPEYGDKEEFKLEKQVFLSDDGSSLDPLLLAQMGGLITIFAACRTKARWERTSEPPSLLVVKVEVVAA